MALGWAVALAFLHGLYLALCLDDARGQARRRRVDSLPPGSWRV